VACACDDNEFDALRAQRVHERDRLLRDRAGAHRRRGEQAAPSLRPVPVPHHRALRLLVLYRVDPACQPLPVSGQALAAQQAGEGRARVARCEPVFDCVFGEVAQRPCVTTIRLPTASCSFTPTGFTAGSRQTEPTALPDGLRRRWERGDRRSPSRSEKMHLSCLPCSQRARPVSQKLGIPERGKVGAVAGGRSRSPL